MAGVVAVSCRESARPGGILPGGLSRLRWPLAPAARVAVAEGIGPESGRVSRLRVARWHIPARCPGPESVAGIGGGHIPAAVVLILTARRESVAVAVPD